MEPYRRGIIPQDIYFSKKNVTGKLVSIMDAKLQNRQLKLINESTRAFRKYDLIELIATREVVKPGDNVNAISYLGFLEVEEGGIIRINDDVEIDQHLIGKVLGFDATHMPNHYNLIVNVNFLKTGYELGLDLNDKVKFIYNIKN